MPKRSFMGVDLSELSVSFFTSLVGKVINKILLGSTRLNGQCLLVSIDEDAMGGEYLFATSHC